MRVLAAAVVTAIVLFFFGFLWWGVLMPIVRPANVISDQAVVDNMSNGLGESGVYFHPDYGDQEAREDDGPMVIAYFFTDQPAMGPMMGAGFGHMLFTALLVSWIVSVCGRPAFADRFKIVFLMGLFVALWADVGNMIWWRHPPKWAAFHIGYDVLAWTVAGLVIAAMLKPAAESSSESAAV